MSIWSKIDRFFAPNPSQQEGAAAAAAAAAADIPLYVKGLITRPERAKNLIERVEEFEKLPKEQQAKEATALYLDLEEYVIQNEPIKQFTKESFRREISDKTHLDASGLPFKGIFLEKNEGTLELFRLVFNQAASTLENFLGTKTLEDLVFSAVEESVLNGTKVSNANLDFSTVIERMKKLEPKSEDIKNALKKLAEKIYIRIKDVRGEKVIDALRSEFELIKKNYHFNTESFELVEQILGSLEKSTLQVPQTKAEQPTDKRTAREKERDKMKVKLKKLEKEASDLVTKSLPSVGLSVLEKVLNKQTNSNILRGTILNPAGELDFSVAESKYLKLPPQWLKLVEKFLHKLIDELKKLKVDSDTSVSTAKKPMISVSGETQKILSSIGLEKLIEKGFIDNVNTYLNTKSGKSISTNLTGSILQDELGNMSGMVLTARDLSELKQYASQRLSAITPVLQKISNGDFTQQFELPEKDDEFTKHLTSLNTMVDDLRKLQNNKIDAEQAKIASETRLQREKAEMAEKLADELEGKVEERTKELQDAIDKVKASEQQFKAVNQQIASSNQQLAASEQHLQDKLIELERFNKVAVGRELKMVELKKELERLKSPSINKEDTKKAEENSTQQNTNPAVEAQQPTEQPIQYPVTTPKSAPAQGNTEK